MHDKTRWFAVASALAALMGCGGDDGNSAGTGAAGMVAGTGAAGMVAGTGAAGMVAGTGAAGMVAGTGGGTVDPLANSGEINPDCTMVPPLSGPGAQQGPCCHRASNAAKEPMIGPNEDGRLEYRLQSVVVMNHMLTIGDPFLLSVNKNRYDAEEQSTLWTFIGPRMNGMEVSGPGMAIIGSGRYNCDGTYSYFSANAAPQRPIVGGDNPARWVANTVPTVVDVNLHGRDRSKTPFTSNRNRELAHVPFLPSGGGPLDWELVTQGFDIETIDTEGPGRDCMGSRDGTEWITSGTFRIFTPLEHNSTEIIPLISRTYCGLVGFGLAAPAGINCPDVPRCMPGTAGCDWVKLPDSLCPSTDAEKAMWGCHVGYESNPDMEPTNCTQEAPTTVLDPDQGATSEGQCCNPLGDAAPNALPACNSWMLRQAYVAAAAEITDTVSDDLPVTCPAP